MSNQNRNRSIGSSQRQYLPVDVLPHESPMILIDSITDWGDDWIETTAGARETNLFNDGAGISEVICMEYLCQSAAAHAGIKQLEQDKPVTIGFIMGARVINIDAMAYKNARHFIARIEQTFRGEDDYGIGVYECQLFDADRHTVRVASATIKAVMPKDPMWVIQKPGNLST